MGQHLVEHFRLRVERLRVLSGADGASAFLPTPWPGAAEPLLLHTGTLAPAAELETLERAQDLHRRHSESRGPDAAAALLRIVASETPGAVLLPVPDSVALAAGRSSPANEGRRLSDREPVALAGWLGLVFGPGEQGRGALDRLRVGDLLGLANSLAHTFVALHSLRSDPLTGLPGRAVLHGLVSEGLRYASERRHAFSVVLVNPDGFGRVNERFGVAAGDHALREAVVRLQGALRTDDVVARYGAATLAVLLPGTSGDHTVAVAEKVRRALSAGDYLAGQASLTFCAGAVTWQPGDPEPRDAGELLQRADSALALARQAGGNRCTAWSGGADPRSAPRLDRLGGVFTGDPNKDYRNLALLWDALTGAWSGGTPEELASKFVEQLRTALRPSFVGLYRAADGALGDALASAGADDSGTGQAARPDEADLALLRAACAAGDARHEVARGHDRVLAVPIKAGDAVLAGLLLVGPAQRLRADASDLTFLEGFAAGMGVAMDRARLAGQERDRLEHERRRLAGEVKELRSALNHVKLVYDSPAVEQVVFDARRVADTDATVLITGESGTGKGLLAQTIHLVSRRRAKPFVVVDCSAIPPNLIESELFGHERGAFTGALQRNPGRIVAADGGTLLLDEVGELPLEVQAKLLRFVEEKQLTSVGSHVSRRVDVRILAATNRDLAREVEAGRFRLDLYHRLSVVPLELPPLRARQQDVLLLARHFLASYATKYQKRVCRIEPELQERMVAYPWPGNIRELQNRLLRAVILADGESLTSAQMPLEVADARSATQAAAAEARDVAAVAAGPTAVVPGGLPLARALSAAVDAVAAAPAHLRPPLGRWLDDDLVLLAFEACDGVARRAAAALALPDTTYARRLQRAQRDAALGTRPPYWAEVHAAAADLVRHPPPVASGASLLDLAESLLLEQIERRFPDNPRAGAALLGTSLPTFRRRQLALPQAS